MRKLKIIDSLQNIDKEMTLLGRVETVRDHGKVLFIDLKDETGVVQTVSRTKHDVSPEDILKIEGLVKKRPDNLINKDLETGTIEIEVKELEIISKAQTPPIPTEGEGYDIEENLRLKFRYLDLRRQRLQKNLRLRSQLSKLTRDYLTKEEFTEIETPYLSKTTPEGARDFLVPSRLHPSKFYALAQAPQQYKQLLMLSGFERYFQFARAFRDEDMRADRQYEHTQIDIEASFIKREDIFALVEGMFENIAKNLNRKIKKNPFPVFTYHQAVKKFGQDKFDLRENKTSEELAFAWVVDFPLFEYDEKEKRYTFSHNPFSSPKEESTKDLMEGKNLDKILSYQYDLVLNGEEIASGSIRITDPKVQKQIFKIMGYEDKKIEEDFGHLLKAYEYGAPPHGGIAIGFDRVCAIFAGEKSIREVIAFPVSGAGTTAVMEAPSKADPQTLKDLKLKVA